jgi:hypothetical protein
MHDRQVRFTLPDPVLNARRATTNETWMSHPTAGESVMMQVSGLGAFVRVLLPVRLTEGHTVTFGVWLAIDPRELESVYGAWWKPEYRELRLTGRLANIIPPWGMLAAPVATVVRDAEQTPYCDRSDDPLLDRVLHDEWAHDLVLSAVDKA